MTLPVLGLALLAPALVAALLSRRWPGRPFGLAAGWLGSTLWLTGLPVSWPLATSHRLPLLALLAALLAAPPLRPWRGAVGWLLGPALCLSWAYARMPATQAALALGVGALVGAGLFWSAGRSGGAGLARALCLALGAGCVLATGNLTLSLSGLALASAAAGATLAGAQPPVTAGASALILAGLLEAGRHTGRLSLLAEGAALLSLMLVGQRPRASAPLALLLAAGALAASLLR